MAIEVRVICMLGGGRRVRGSNASSLLLTKDIIYSAFSITLPHAVKKKKCNCKKCVQMLREKLLIGKW